MAASPATTHNTQTSHSEAKVEQATRDLLNQEWDFISNSSFQEPGIEPEILETGSIEEFINILEASELTGPLPSDLPAHLGRLCEERLLSAVEERSLFRQYNYLRYRSNALRSMLDPDAPDAGKVERIHQYLRAAQLVREKIIKANIRLVISIVKKFVSPHQSFDEMLSEGIFSLIQAVEKFDYDRGFRFSTYAYRAISRHAYRTIADRHKDRSRFTTGTAEVIVDVEDAGPDSSLNEGNWAPINENLVSMMGRLDRRERFIIRGRFALGRNRKARTFQSLADVLGISKERVRQLEQRAVAKLQQMAEERNLEELVDPA